MMLFKKKKNKEKDNSYTINGYQYCENGKLIIHNPGCNPFLIQIDNNKNYYCIRLYSV